jgi:hypothetical protein
MNRSSNYTPENPPTSISSASSSFSTAMVSPSEAEKHFLGQESMASQLPDRVNHNNFDRLAFERQHYRPTQSDNSRGFGYGKRLGNTEDDRQTKMTASPTSSHRPTTTPSPFHTAHQPQYGELSSRGGDNVSNIVRVAIDPGRRHETTYCDAHTNDNSSIYQKPRPMVHREINDDDDDEVNEGGDMFVFDEVEREPGYQRRYRQTIPLHVEQRQSSWVSSLGDSIRSESDLFSFNDDGNLSQRSLLPLTPPRQQQQHRKQPHQSHQQPQEFHHPQPLSQHQPQYQHQPQQYPTSSLSCQPTARSTALAHRRPTKAKSADAAIQVDRTLEPTERQPILVEIAPGLSVPLRGANETMRAMQTDNGITETTCVCCTARVRCIATAMYVICPTCRVVSHVPFGKWGVGLGF